MISGFMIVRNGIALGYPFAEAVRSMLPLCDEVLIADGGSDDGTWDVLQQLAASDSRIHVSRKPWPAGVDSRHVIAGETNALRRLCRGDRCFNFQANEIVHEKTVAEIARLPELYPAAALFRLPYLTVMGTSIAWQIDHRRRLFANVPEIVSRGDGYDCGYDPRKLARSPRRAWRYLLHREGEQIAHLTIPVFRYRALFPRNYLTKLRSRIEKTDAWKRELAHAERAFEECDRTSPQSFWRLMKPFFEPCLPDVEDAPAIVRPLLDRM